MFSRSTFWLNRCSRCRFLSTFKHTDKTHYNTLGVNRNASKREIRSAFLTLSKLHHPDISSSKNAHKNFMEINEAYNILYNPAKRYQYDMQLHSSAQLAGRSNSPGHPSQTVAYHYAQDYYNVSEKEWAEMYQKSTSRPNHAPLIMVLVAVMVTGSIVHSFRIRAAHKQFQERANEETRRNIEVYNEVRERAASSTVNEQLERLSKRHEYDTASR